MTLNKQLSSSTGSSSGSSSDSSSTSASSSSSYSESSSSDTDSSSSEQTAQPAPTAASPPRRPTPRRSTDTRPSQPTPTPATPAAAKPPTEKPSTSRLKTPVKSPVKKSSVSSSEEDVVVKTEEKNETLPPRRRSSTKPKNAATATPRPVGRPPSKPPPVASSVKNEVKKPLKKKSIFSPDNTSESETEQASSKVKTSAKSSSSKAEQPQKPAPVPAAPAPAPRPKGRPPKNASAIANNQKATKPPPPTPEKPKEEAQPTCRQKRGSVTKPPPAVKKKAEKEKASNKYPSKAYVSSSCSSSANTESSGSGSSSDSDSSSSSRKSDVSRRSKSSTKSEMSRKSEAIKRSEQTPRKNEVKKNEPRRRSGGAEADKKPEEEKKSVAQPATTRRSGRPGRSSNRTGSGSGSGSNISKVEVKTEKESTAIVTDSDAENTKPANSSISSGPSLSASKSAITRKLTRSALTRKSRHLVGRGAHSDTDSDAESGTATRSSSKSPVKRTSVPTKGPPAILCPMKARGFPPNIAPRVPDKDQELMCPLPGCDSKGHLSGRLEKHFTIEACPRYHNTTPEECVERFQALKTTLEARKMAHHALQMRRNIQPSLEQRAYQLKVKDMRSKWKPVNSSVSASASVSASNNSNSNNSVSNVSASGSGGGGVANTSASSNNTNVSSREESKEKLKGDGDLEPVLDGFVPDYDLALFREAQAAAAFKIEEELKNIPPSKGTRYVCMGRYCMEAWYQSPYPADAARLPQIYLCEFCLNHHKTAAGMSRHRAKCEWRHPPGDEVYRKGPLGVWQVDGRKHKQYCQQLCLLAKFFLDHKTLYYDVEPFLFYVMTLADTEGCHTVGYFSKEKNSVLNYNVSCILTLPPYQRQGYGRLLIDFSYLLTKVEGKIGSPEKPLSDLGLISYRSYWKDVLLQYLCAHSGSAISIKDLSQEMAINSYDIVSTLQALGMMKYWKGKHIILKKQDVLDEYMERVKKRGQVKTIDPNCLKWKPYVPPTSQSGS